MGALGDSGGRLQRIVGLSGQVLSWIRSFLTERSQRVAYAWSLSLLIVLLWGVPQGYVLWPLLFLLYTAELFDIMSHGASAHYYADTDDAINCLQACVAAVEHWMKNNRLRLNPQKTQLIWLGSQQQLDKVTTTDVQLLNASIHPLSAVYEISASQSTVGLRWPTKSPPFTVPAISGCASCEVSK